MELKCPFCESTRLQKYMGAPVYRCDECNKYCVTGIKETKARKLLCEICKSDEIQLIYLYGIFSIGYCNKHAIKHFKEEIDGIKEKINRLKTNKETIYE